MEQEKDFLVILNDTKNISDDKMDTNLEDENNEDQEFPNIIHVENENSVD